jgi:uncharacterized protein (DUF4415 family)
MMQKGAGSMNIIKDKEFDYQAYTKEHPPETAKIRRGLDARKQRFEAARMKTAVRIEKDILEQFQQIAQTGQDHEKLINQALREWLSAKDLKALIRTDLREIVEQALSSNQVGH